MKFKNVMKEYTKEMVRHYLSKTKDALGIVNDDERLAEMMRIRDKIKELPNY